MTGNLLTFLRRELQPAAGRSSYALRLTITCGILILLFMTLQIPLLSVALIVAFYASQSNITTIKLLSIAFFLLVSLIIAGIILMLKFTYDYPLLRLVCSSLLFFGAMFLMRALDKLGLAFFIVALAVIFAQTFPSMTGNSEIVIRLILWLWVAINTSVLVTLLVNACFRQAFPAVQFRRRLAEDFRRCAAQLSSYSDGEFSSHRTEASALAKQYLQLTQLGKLAENAPEMRHDKAQWQSLMAAAIQFSYLVMLLPPRATSNADRQHFFSLSVLLNDLAARCERGSAPLEGLVCALPPATAGEDVVTGRLLALAEKLGQGQPITLPEYQPEKAPLLLPDAFTNPVYPQFALKTLLATLLCYLFYTATDWQGIHTIMLSCVIVAQPGLGPTMQKTWLRIGGALLATLLALVLIVFVQPYTSSVTGLLMMSLPVMWLAAWIAGGSEKTAYAGIQIGFTFALGFLDWFGPLYSLTELRDRAIGILLGVLVSSLVHLYLWPESEAMKLRAQLAVFFRQMSGWLAAGKTEQQHLQLPLYQSLLTTEKLLERVLAEPVLAYAYPYPQVRQWPLKRSFAQAQEILRLSEGYRLCAAADDPFLAQCAVAVNDYAVAIEQSASVLLGIPAPDSNNPYAQPLLAALEMLPGWALSGRTSASRTTSP